MSSDISVAVRASPAAAGRRITLWERFAFQTMRMLVRLLARAVSLTGLYTIGRSFATLEWLINYKRRRRFREQLGRIFGDGLSPAQKRLHTRRHFIRTRCDKLFYLIFDHLPHQAIAERFTVTNRHLLDEGLSRGKGVYVALAHFGSQHVAGMLLVELGYKVAGVRDAKEGGIRRFIQDKYERKQRERVRYFFSDAYPRDLYRCFADNFVLGSAIDVQRDRGGHLKTIEATMFGERRSFLAGPMLIAVRCGAPILQGLLVARENFHYVFELIGPLADPATETVTPERLNQAMQVYASNVERFTRQYPCHVTRL